MSIRDQWIASLELLEDEVQDRHVGGDRVPGRFEGKVWYRDADKRQEGGGQASVLKGRLFEKAAVHFSALSGKIDAKLGADVPGLDAEGRFWASGVSVIVHPVNPYVPAFHMNLRFIVTRVAWFGGGGDLTPMLGAFRSKDHADAKLFHKALKDLCARHERVADYDRFSSQCDAYFFLPHRKEARGVGGLFFDQMTEGDFDERLDFAGDLGHTMIDAYGALVRERFSTPWTDAERNEQLVRRGRYVEFNLLYDRGTAFGLKSGGNVDAILGSLPPLVRFPS